MSENLLTTSSSNKNKDARAIELINAAKQGYLGKCSICQKENISTRNFECLSCRKIFCNVCCYNHEHKTIEQVLCDLIRERTYLRSIIWKKIAYEDAAFADHYSKDDLIYKIVFESTTQDVLNFMDRENQYDARMFLFYKLVAMCTHTKLEAGNSLSCSVNQSEIMPIVPKRKVNIVFKLMEDDPTKIKNYMVGVDLYSKFIEPLSQPTFDSRLTFAQKSDSYPEKIDLQRVYCQSCKTFHIQIESDNNIEIECNIKFLSEIVHSHVVQRTFWEMLRDFFLYSNPILAILFKKWDSALLAPFWAVPLVALFLGYLPNWTSLILMIYYFGTVINGPIDKASGVEKFRKNPYSFVINYIIIWTIIITLGVFIATDFPFLGINIIICPALCGYYGFYLSSRNLYCENFIDTIKKGKLKAQEEDGDAELLQLMREEDRMKDEDYDIKKKEFISLNEFYSNLDSDITLKMNNFIFKKKNEFSKFCRSFETLEIANSITTVLLCAIFACYEDFNLGFVQEYLTMAEDTTEHYGSFIILIQVMFFQSVIGFMIKIVTGYIVNQKMEDTIDQMSHVQEVLSTIQLSPSLILFNRSHFKVSSKEPLLTSHLAFTFENLSQKFRNHYKEDTSNVIMALSHQLIDEYKDESFTYDELNKKISDISGDCLHRLESVKAQYLELFDAVAFKLVGWIVIDKKLLLGTVSIAATALVSYVWGLIQPTPSS